MLNKVGGRKMAVGFLTLGIGVAFAAVKGDVNPGLLQLLSVVFGAYVVGNGFEHIANSRKPAKEDKPTYDPLQIEGGFATMQTQLDQVRALSEQAAAGSAASAQALNLIMEVYVNADLKKRGLIKDEPAQG